MEAIIRTNDKNRFLSLIQFLRSLNFQVGGSGNEYMGADSKFFRFNKRMTKEEHIKYWIEQSEDSWESAIALINSKRYMMALFCWHLTIEKLLKALWVKSNTKDYPPRIHNLSYLHDEAKLNLPDEMQAESRVINTWNIEGRYPDYQAKLYKSITKEYVESKTQILLTIKKCLHELLQ